jgi:beta-xylosidase
MINSGWFRGFALIAAFMFILSGCNPQPEAPSGEAGTGVAEPGAAGNNPQPSGQLSPSVDPALLYNNPVVRNGADPGVLRASDGKYYAYITGKGYRAYSSTDLVHWKSEGQALPPAELSSWATTGFWAPDVLEYKGKYYMFFSAAKKDGDPKHMSVAVSESPKGPFKHPEKGPVFSFGKDLDQVGVIDAHAFVDEDGKVFLYFTKTLHPVEGHVESEIYGVELNEDLHSYKGEPVKLTHPEQAWETVGNKRWNEGVWMLKHNGTYYLMFSANCYCNRNYGVGYATSKSPLGPFKKWENNPVLQSVSSTVSGTGHHSVVKSPDGKELWVVYHSHANGKPGAGRQLDIDRMGFREDGTMYVNGPTVTKQLKPSGMSEWTNIAPAAQISVSSSKSGSGKSLIDGEIGISAKFAQYDWVPKAEETSWVNLEWKEPREVAAVVLYDSGDARRAVSSGKLILDDGTEYDIVFPAGSGAAAMTGLGGKKVKSIKLVLVRGSGTKDLGMSEITVMGK